MGVRLRPVEESDLENIMRWRMDEDITKYMNTNPRLTMEGQRRWLASIRADSDVAYWLIEIDGQDAGVVSLKGLDNPDGEVGWAYYIGEKKLRSIKTALSLEMSLYDYVFGVLHKRKLVGDIFTLNQGVIRLHQMCGSEIVEERKAHVRKEEISYDVTFMCITAQRWHSIRDTKKYERIAFPPVAAGRE